MEAAQENIDVVRSELWAFTMNIKDQASRYLQLYGALDDAFSHDFRAWSDSLCDMANNYLAIMPYNLHPVDNTGDQDAYGNRLGFPYMAPSMVNFQPRHYLFE